MVAIFNIALTGAHYHTLYESHKKLLSSACVPGTVLRSSRFHRTKTRNGSSMGYASVLSGSIKIMQSLFHPIIEQYFIVIVFHLLFICDCFLVSLHFPGHIICILLFLKKWSIMRVLCFFSVGFQTELHCLFITSVYCERLCPHLESSVMSVLRRWLPCTISNQATNHKAHSTNSGEQYSCIFSWSSNLQIVFQASTTKTFPVSVMFSILIIFSLS